MLRELCSMLGQQLRVEHNSLRIRQTISSGQLNRRLRSGEGTARSRYGMSEHGAFSTQQPVRLHPH